MLIAEGNIINTSASVVTAPPVSDSPADPDTASFPFRPDPCGSWVQPRFDPREAFPVRSVRFQCRAGEISPFHESGSCPCPGFEIRCGIRFRQQISCLLPIIRISSSPRKAALYPVCSPNSDHSVILSLSREKERIKVSCIAPYCGIEPL